VAPGDLNKRPGAAQPPELASDGTRDDEGRAYSTLAERIQDGDRRAEEELYRLINGGVRLRLVGAMGDDVGDSVHDIYIDVLTAIRKRQLREPPRLVGFVDTILRRRICLLIAQKISARRAIDLVDCEEATGYDSPLEQALARDERDLAATVLASMPDRERDILKRFYLDEQTQAEICRELNLTETQFRLRKSRAKAQFARIGQRIAKGAVFP
jgi:RNA polymerase sigma-70 factor (ECF subfamily)